MSDHKCSLCGCFCKKCNCRSGECLNCGCCKLQKRKLIDLSDAHRIVASWPKWKRDMADQMLRPSQPPVKSLEEFDKEFVADAFKPLSEEEKERFERAKGK